MANANALFNLSNAERLALDQCASVNADIAGGGFNLAKGNIDACLKTKTGIHEQSRAALIKAYEFAYNVSPDQKALWLNCRASLVASPTSATADYPMCGKCRVDDTACLVALQPKNESTPCAATTPAAAEACARSQGNSASAWAGMMDMLSHFRNEMARARESCELRRISLDTCPEYASAMAVLRKVARDSCTGAAFGGGPSAR